jgi:hypothetical protein
MAQSYGSKANFHYEKAKIAKLPKSVYVLFSVKIPNIVGDFLFIMCPNQKPRLV